jgi:hypothetical protein
MALLDLQDQREFDHDRDERQGSPIARRARAARSPGSLVLRSKCLSA